MSLLFSLRGISKSFRENSSRKLPVLENINLKITKGEFLVILGPSGSGKSTLLRIMSGLETEYEGSLEREEGVTASDFGFVFQHFAIFPWLTVRENIALGLCARHEKESLIEERVERELTRFGLEKFADSFPKELSGGMGQRVGIARALAVNPKVIFMDEPFSELDSFTATGLRKEFLHVWKETKPTIIMVTHLIDEALELADRIAVLTPRPGTIEKILVNSLSRPRNKRAEEFFRIEDRLYELIKP